MADDTGQLVTLTDYRATSQMLGTTKLARSLHSGVVALIQEIEDKGTMLGALLWQIREDGLYRELGYETFPAYLESPDVHLSRSHSYKLIAIAEAVCPEVLHRLPNSPNTLPQAPLFSRAELAEMGVERATMVLPLIRREPDKAEDWVARAQTLTPTDLALAIRERRDPSFSQLQEAAFELGRKLAGMAYHLRDTHGDPLAALDALIVEAEKGRDWILTLLANNRTAEEWEQPDATDRQHPGSGTDEGRPGANAGVSGTHRGAEPVHGDCPGDALDHGVS
jgi:hypothetical protein